MKGRAWSRRDAFRLSGGAAAGLMATRKPVRAKSMSNIYTRIGVKPFINLTATYTINGGALTLPEVKRAMDEASRYSVNLDELMEKVGARLAELMGAEAAIVTSGCAAALAHSTAAAIAGADPEKMQRLPHLDGMRDQVIMPKQSRNAYDHAFRSPGATIVEIDTAEEFHNALSDRVALVAVLGTGEPKGRIRLEEMVAAAHKRGIPVIVDAAAELPFTPNPYLSRGADLVAYSGGKFLRGPQCAGILLGRKDLVQAAWLNSSPHHAFGRSMKVGKEEIMGMLAAIEVWKNSYDLKAEYREWESWFQDISAAVTKVGGVSTRVLPPAGASPFPVMEVSWDPARVGLTAGEVGQQLLDGEPRIMSHAEGEGHSFIIRPVAIQRGDHKTVAARLAEILRQAPPVRTASAAVPARDISGNWRVTVEFIRGSAEHHLELSADGASVAGTHRATSLTGRVQGTVRGSEIRLRSALPCEGTRLTYEFTGKVEGEHMSGEVGLGEYGRARWSAVRV
ncbi:MAG: aminotransferase class V-fold PLP-dependent enzyme [Bryobacteraceae bacterium]|nr:aminotransferase class V-fold PLP-dependent enzyme [Bryobacteraceae bacterium]